jgi:preprotein translocase subunit YajC
MFWNVFCLNALIQRRATTGESAMKLFMLLTLMSVFVWFSYIPMRREAKQRSRAWRDSLPF